MLLVLTILSQIDVVIRKTALILFCNTRFIVLLNC